jgi:isoleucyl-tRNA synthetase
VKKVKPNFRTLGPKIGKLVKEVGPALANISQEDIQQLESEGKITLSLSSQSLDLTLDDAEIVTEDIPGWSVASDGRYTVALDLHISEELEKEGIARELVKRIQDLRKSQGFEVTDRIRISLSQNDAWDEAVKAHEAYIKQETLANDLDLVTSLPKGEVIAVNDIQGTMEVVRE